MMESIKKFAKAILFGRPRGVVSQPDFLMGREGGWFEAAPADNRVRKEPLQLGSRRADFSSMVAPLPALGIHVLEKGRVIGSTGWVFTSSGDVIAETTWYGTALKDSMLPSHFPRPVRLRGTCLSLVSDFSKANYGHYVLDCLSRIGIVQKAGWDVSTIDHFYIHRPPSKSADQLIEMLGIDRTKCVWAGTVKSFVADKVLVTTFPGRGRDYSTIVPETLSRPFADLERGGRKIYIPRVGIRSISNSAEIERISIEADWKYSTLKTSRMNLPIFDR